MGFIGRLQRLFTRGRTASREEPCSNPECHVKPEDDERLKLEREAQARMWAETEAIKNAAERYGDDGARRRYLVEIERDVLQRRRPT